MKKYVYWKKVDVGFKHHKLVKRSQFGQRDKSENFEKLITQIYNIIQPRTLFSIDESC